MKTEISNELQELLDTNNIKWNKKQQDILNRYDMFSYDLIKVSKTDSKTFREVACILEDYIQELDDEQWLIECDSCSQAMKMGLQDFTTWMNQGTCDEGWYDFGGDWYEFVNCDSDYTGTLIDDDLVENDNEAHGIGTDSDGLIKNSDEDKVRELIKNQKVSNWDSIDWTPISKYIITK